MTIARYLGRIELKSKSTIIQFRFKRTKKSFLRVRKKELLTSPPYLSLDHTVAGPCRPLTGFSIMLFSTYSQI